MLAGWLAALALLGCAQGYGQASGQKLYTVTGRVVEDDGGEPIPLVKVVVSGRTEGANTGLDGTFTIKLPAGAYTLRFLYVGYQELKVPITVEYANVPPLMAKLVSLSYQLEGLTITTKDNPAKRIMKKVIQNKKFNRMDRLDSYEYESYSKLSVVLDNIPESDLDRSLLSNAKDIIKAQGLDTLATSDSAGKRYRLPIFFSEAITEVYFKRPAKKKERILATRQKGAFNTEVAAINSLFSIIDIYKNIISILGKEFVSPVADGAFQNYDYYIERTERNARDTTYYIGLYPLNPNDRAFKGILIVNQRDWALKGIDLRMNTDPNINFVEDIRIRQEFGLSGEQWVLTLSDIEVDLKNFLGEGKGGKGRSQVYLYNHRLNESRPDKFFQNETIQIMDGATSQTDQYWREHQVTPLAPSEQMVFTVMDTLRKQFIWQVYNTGIDFLVGGLKRVGPVSIGPYSKLVSGNPVEGLRNQIGVYTNERFSKRLQLGLMVAYGWRDQRGKYDADIAYALWTRPRIELGYNRTQDIEQTGFKNFSIEGTGILNTVLRRVPIRQLNYFVRDQLRAYADIMNGVAATATLTSKAFYPAFDVGYLEREGSTRVISNYRTTDFGLLLRLSVREKYILKGNEKVYLYTHFPQLYLEGNVGLRGFLGGEYAFTSFTATLTNRYKLGRFGKMRFIAQVGAVSGTLPFPSLYVFKGNQNYGVDPIGRPSDLSSSIMGRVNRTALYDALGFNLMYFYEFVADRYALFGIDHHLEGYILGKLPLIKKLEWKEIFTFRIGYGTLTAANKRLNNIGLLTVAAPDGVPYGEIGFGIENIFKVFRVDAIWRLSYRDPRPPAEIANFQYNFGLRFNARVGL